MAKLKIRPGDKVTESVEKFVHEQLRAAFMPPVPFIIGKKYIIRTITMINVGRLVSIVGNFLILDDASWIADAGKWGECLTKPEGIRVSEKYRKPVYISIDAIVDATEWELELPTKSISRK